MITALLMALGFIITVFFIFSIVRGRSVFGSSPNPIILVLISIASPVFGMAIAYIQFHQSVPILIAAVVNLLSVFQFIYWYLLACTISYLNEKYLKREKFEFPD